jgi:hypothetical protein
LSHTQKRPAGNGASQKISEAADLLKSTARHEVLDADERRERALIEELLDRGYRVAVQCVDCGAWLVAAHSVRDHIGPVCRSRRGGDAQ